MRKTTVLVGGGLLPSGPLLSVVAHRRRRAERLLKGVKLETTHVRMRPFSCKGLDEHTADSFVFQMEEEETSVAAYFNKKYNLKLQYPHLSLVVAGSSKHKRRFPIEVRRCGCLTPCDTDIRRPRRIDGRGSRGGLEGGSTRTFDAREESTEKSNPLESEKAA